MDHQPSILVIDDEPLVCESCHRILSIEDYKVDTYTNPKEGYQRAITNNYDLILLDLMMDEMDGMELLSALREKKPDIPVIIITGYPTKISKEEATHLGVQYYILKPFMPNEILDPVTNIITHTTPLPKEEILDFKQFISLPKWECAEQHFRFYKDGWSQKGLDGSIRVGGQIPGLTSETIESITIPDVNNLIYRDLPLAEVTFADKTKRIIPSAISGKIIEVNKELENDLPLIENNNYEKFWIARILSSDIGKDLKASLTRDVLFFSKDADDQNKYYGQLIDLGCIVKNTSSIDEVIKILDEGLIKTVVMDAVPFAGSGPEYIKKINKHSADVKIIIFDKINSPLEPLYRKSRFFDYATPPIHTKKISDILSNAFYTGPAGDVVKVDKTVFLPEIIEKIHIPNRYVRKETGIYFLDDTFYENPDPVDISAVSDYAYEIPGVTAIWHSTDLPLTEARHMATKIRENNLKRIIIAGDTPGQVKNFFTKAMIIAGNDPKDVILASFKDHGAIYKSHTERARAILLSALYGICFDMAVQPDDNPVNSDTLVIGAGIAGIQASLEIANSGNKVYLVEKSATIGGHMATFDKTFPTLDCAACILTPKMVEVGQHPNIELLTYCEVKGVSGEPGNYKAKIFKKARYVDLKSCTGCGNCASKCPTSVPSEFDSGTTLRKAIYMPFPQAVPNKYLIDAANCRYIKDGKCGVCVKNCPVDSCINLDEKDEEVEITVGNIILATGFKPFDARRIEDYGYGKYPNVLTSLEFERLVNASGPTGGKINLRTKDKRGNPVFTPDSEEPGSIAIIHCVGSRDINYNPYCSKVCCMYSLKLAHLVKEKLPDARVYEYYIDIRAFGKGYEEFYNRIKKEGVDIIRGRPAKIEEANGHLLLRTEDIMNDTMVEQEVDMVVLSVGLEPGENTSELAEMLGIYTTEDGWLMEANNIFDPVSTCSGGITIAGACQGPKDIPATVAHASAAAARVIQNILKKRVKKDTGYLSLRQIEQNVMELSDIKMINYERVY
ncbi:MAG: response regulator [Bacteroidales bacterium]|nr:response regulator [Bacteroidales bacterium]